MTLPIGLTSLKMVLELVSDFREHILHLAVFLGHYINDVLDLLIDVMAQLARSLWGLVWDLLDGHVQLFVWDWYRLLKVVEVVGDHLAHLHCDLLEILILNGTWLHFCLNEACDCVHQLALVVFVQVVLFSQAFLNFLYFKSESGLLLFSFPSLDLKLIHQSSKLLLHAHLQPLDWLLFFQEFISDGDYVIIQKIPSISLSLALF